MMRSWRLCWAWEPGIWCWLTVIVGNNKQWATMKWEREIISDVRAINCKWDSMPVSIRYIKKPRTPNHHLGVTYDGSSTYVVVRAKPIFFKLGMSNLQAACSLAIAHITTAPPEPSWQQLFLTEQTGPKCAPTTQQQPNISVLLTLSGLKPRHGEGAAQG